MLKNPYKNVKIDTTVLSSKVRSGFLLESTSAGGLKVEKHKTLLRKYD
jgi:hypothetical protein